MKGIIAILAIGLLGFFAYSAVKKKSGGVRTGVVYYYPRANIYYDVAREQYIFFDEKKRAWKETSDFSEEQKLSLGEKAVIPHPSTPIWQNNSQDRLVYSVNLYASGTDLRQKYLTDSLNSLPKPLPDTPKWVAPRESKPSQEEEKPKSGIRKFFEKLFGGGKDKNKNS